jgi:hypothetical protein
LVAEAYSGCRQGPSPDDRILTQSAIQTLDAFSENYLFSHEDYVHPDYLFPTNLLEDLSPNIQLLLLTLIKKMANPRPERRPDYDSIISDLDGIKESISFFFSKKSRPQSCTESSPRITKKSRITSPCNLYRSDQTIFDNVQNSVMIDTGTITAG